MGRYVGWQLGCCLTEGRGGQKLVDSGHECVWVGSGESTAVHQACQLALGVYNQQQGICGPNATPAIAKCSHTNPIKGTEMRNDQMKKSNCLKT